MTLDAVNDLLAPKKDPLIVGGRYNIRGEKFTRVTNFASTIDDRHTLELWQQRMCVTGIVERRDLYAMAASHLDDKQKLNDICDQAIEAAKGKAGANLGTSLHAFAEQVDRGETPTIPSPWDADIAAYVATLQANHVLVDPALMEGVVVNRTFNVAGRYDRIVRLGGYPIPMIADLKTGNIEHNLGSIAVQLCLYATADELYDPETDELKPMPRIDEKQALVIHLPAGEARCDLYLIDIEAGLEAAELCQKVRAWRSRKELSRPFVSTPLQRTHWLKGRAATLSTEYPDAFAELAARWPAGVPTLGKTGHTDDQLKVITTLIDDVEARHQVVFSDEPDPMRRRPPQQVIDALVERAACLPADLVEQINRRGDSEGLPSVRSRKFLQMHVEPTEFILGEFEAAYEARFQQVCQLFNEVSGDDVELGAVLIEACGAVESGGLRWTHQQVEWLEHIRQGVSDLVLGFAETDGRIHLAHINGDGRLVERYGSKRDALAVCKQLADEIGRPRPKSVADAAGDPVLIAAALTTNESNQATTESREQAA